MISLYSGTPGSGKSCHAAREIALRLQRKDSVVIGNFYFNTKAVKKCKGVYLYVPNHRLDPDKLLRFSRRLSKHLGVALRTKRKIFSYKIQKPLLKRNLKKDA